MISTPPRFELRHPLCDVVVVTDSSAVETQLRHRLEPYIEVSPVTEVPRRPDLVVVAHEESVALPAEPPGEIMIRDHPQFERYRRPADLWQTPLDYVMRERKNSSVFRWGKDEPARVVVTNADPTSLAKSVRRLVQDYLRLRVWHLGGIIVEASTISIDGMGLLVVGGSGVGKTTLLARFLEAGARMVSNDEVALCRNDAGDVTAYGLPMLVNMRPPLVERFPQLAEFAQYMEGADRKAPIRYDAFANALGGGVQASTDRLVGVLLSPEVEGSADVGADAFASALLGNILSGPGCAGPGWKSPWRLLPPGFPEPDQRELERRAAHVAGRVPAITIGRMHAPHVIAKAAGERLSAGLAE